MFVSTDEFTFLAAVFRVNENDAVFELDIKRSGYLWKTSSVGRYYCPSLERLKVLALSKFHHHKQIPQSQCFLLVSNQLQYYNYKNN